MKLILLLSSSLSLLWASCPHYWLQGVDHGSCSVYSDSLPLIDHTYLGCFYRFVDIPWNSTALPSSDQIRSKEEKCERNLRVLLATSPINRDEIKLEDLPRGFRTALCVLYLHFQELKKGYSESAIPSEIKECPRYGQSSKGSLENQSQIVEGLASDWKSLSHQLRKTVSASGSLNPCQYFWISLAQIIESVLITDCDFCNVCDNSCPSVARPVAPLKDPHTQAQLKAWEHYVADKLNFCPQNWKNGIPKGYEENPTEIGAALLELDLTGTSQTAARSRSSFVKTMISSKFITCQIQTCACPNLFFDESCHSQLYNLQVGLSNSLTYFNLPWSYLNSPKKQRNLFDSFKGVQGTELLKLFQKSKQNPEFKLNNSNMEVLVNGALSERAYQIYLILVDSMNWSLGQNKVSSFSSQATRTALASINEKEQNKGNDPTNYLTELGQLITNESYTELLKSLKEHGFKDEADIMTYSLLPRNISLTQLNMLIYIDRATDDRSNGALVKQFLKNFIAEIHLQNSYFSLCILEFQHTTQAYDSFTPTVLLNDTAPDMTYINKAIDKISLDPKLSGSPFSFAYKHAYDLHKTWNPMNQQVVIMVTSANLDEQSQEFKDTYQVLNRAFLEYDIAVVGVGTKIFEHFSSLELMGKNVKSENFPLAILLNETDITSAVDILERFLHFVTTQPRSIDVGSKVIFILSQDQHIFFRVDTLMSTEGIHLNLTLPKGYTEVYASLSTYHPSKYDFDFQMQLASRQQEVNALQTQEVAYGDSAEYILNIPLYTYEIQQMIALQNSEGFSNWKRHIYIGIHAIQADYVLFGNFEVVPGTKYPFSYISYIYVLVVVLGVILILSCVCFFLLCKQNCCQKKEEIGQFPNQKRLEENSNLLDVSQAQSQKFLSPDDRDNI